MFIQEKPWKYYDEQYSTFLLKLKQIVMMYFLHNSFQKGKFFWNITVGMSI